MLFRVYYIGSVPHGRHSGFSSTSSARQLTSLEVPHGGHLGFCSTSSARQLTSLEVPHGGHLGFCSTSSARQSTSLEMRQLFNWSGMGAKRKHSVSAGGRSKKKRLQMYTHTFCCLAHTSQWLV